MEEPVKAVPKKGETPAEAIARVEKRNPGKKVVDPPSGGKPSYGGRGALTRPSAAGSLLYNRVPATWDSIGIMPFHGGPAMAKSHMYTGVEVETLGWFDTLMSKRASLIWIEFSHFNSTCSDGTPVAPESMISAYLDTIFVELLQKISQAGRYITQTAIYAAGNLASWLNSYGSAYIELRALQAALALDGFNRECSVVAQVIQQNRFRLEADLARINEISIPPGYRELLDKLCGVYILSESTAPILVGFKTNVVPGAMDDISTGAGVQAILTDAETNIAAIFTGGSAQQIMSVFGALYGPPEAPMPKVPITGENMYFLWNSMMAQYRNTTGPVTVTAPNVASLSIVPIQVPYGTDDPLFFSLLRPTVYGVTDNIAAPVLAGMLTWGGAVGSGRVVYAMDGTVNQLQATGAGFNPSNLSLNWLNDLFWLQQVWYGVFAAANVQSWPAQMEAFYVEREILVRETIAQYSDIFFTKFAGKFATP